MEKNPSSLRNRDTWEIEQLNDSLQIYVELIVDDDFTA